MSEAMSSVEIEDVLSSIRRLVSEDLRPAQKAALAPQAKPAPQSITAAQIDDKLMLTPALRVVVSEPQAVAPLRPTPLPRLHLGLATPVRDTAAPDAPAQVERMATLQRAVEAQDTEWESEVGDPQPQVARMEWTEDGWAATGAPDDAATSPPEVASWDQTAPDHAGDALYQPAPPDADEPSADLSGADQAWADQAWADQAEAAALAELQDPEPGQDPEFASELADKPPQVAPRPDEDLTFDEQVLRDLVRDLLREELQGDLGERITRNVRKLVRSEIARMIASQDLD